MKTTLKLVLCYFAYQLLAGAVMTGLGQLFAVGLTTQLAWSLLLSGAAMTVHLVAGGYVDLRKAFRFAGMSAMACSIVCVVAAMLGCNALSTLLALPNWLEADFTALSHNALGIASVALMAPWVEELLFRGAIMHHLHRQGFTPWRGIVLSALVFGLIHVNPAQVPFAFLMGLALGWVTVQTRSLLPAIISHAVNNGLGVMELATGQGGSASMALTGLTTVELSAMAAIGLAAAIVTGRKLTHLVQLDTETNDKPNNLQEK